MRKVSLFIAMSLDGYIADRQGGVDWLKGQDSNAENVDSYSEFVKDIDTILMGWNTYDQITNELSPEQWIYGDFTTYVITHKELVSTEKVRFTSMHPSSLIRKLKAEEGNGIWICGGANLVQQLIHEDLIDCYYITIIPTLLGSGIRLFENEKQELKLRLIRTRSYNGMVDLIYTRR